MTLKVPRCEFVHGLKCEDVSRRITSLEQERDSAREQLRNALDDTRWLDEQNDKLRELARRMWPFAKSYLDMLPALGINDTESFDIYLKMHELGIEEDA